MKSLFAVLGTIILLMLAVRFSVARQSADGDKLVEIAVLDESNWDRFVPLGKEVDAIYGDVVLRNGHLSAVIAQPVATRNANMTTRDVAGAVIDLTLQNHPNDQLTAFYPGKTVFPYRSWSAKDDEGNELALTSVIASKKKSSIAVKSDGTDDRPEAVVIYELRPADPYLTVTTTLTNRSSKTHTVSLEDDFRADGQKEDMIRSPDGTSDQFWLYDRYWGQAYGMDAQGYKLQMTSDSRVTNIKYEGGDGAAQIKLEPGQSFLLKRRLYAGADLVAIKAVGSNLQPADSSTIHLAVKCRQDRPVSHALIEFKRGTSFYASARTDAEGMVTVVLPQAAITADISAFGRQIATNLVVALNPSPFVLKVDFDPGLIEAAITDAGGNPLACKVEFNPRDLDAKLDFGPETSDFSVRNLVYSANGKFRQSIPPGRYGVTISHGPEFDAVFTEIIVKDGETVSLVAKLVRSVETPGWVSGDFHGHSSPSGDNTSSQLGRVLNLVAEQIEFAPCTEHNRISTYQPHIDRLGIASQLASVSGIELTSEPLPLNHQNAFPMKLVPRTQDGGAPISGPDPESQIERLALHDNRSHKLIQVNHPDIGWMFYDKNGDTAPDSGFERMFPFMDVVEVHPMDQILTLGPLTDHGGKLYPNNIFNWLQLLNQGFRIYGVVNTDAHYNFHGSGLVRNWIQSSTDNPTKIDHMEMVRAAEEGRLVMSNGPYLEMTAYETGRTERFVAGQDLKALSGKITLKVRVQCPNWLDVNRLFVLVNGRIHSTHHYSREKNPDRFRGGVVKFDSTLDVELKEDAHLIVATGNTSGKLGTIYGTTYDKTRPAALTNPIFVDVDGSGFQPNKDTLDHPLPTKHPLSR